MGIKDAYNSLEDKWYSFWEKAHLIGAIDAVDKVMPSLVLFVLVIILLIALGAFFLLSQSQAFDAKFTVVTSDNKPVNDSLIKASLMDGGNLVDDISGRTDSAGVITFSQIKMGQDIQFDINLSKGTYNKSFTINGPMDEQIKLDTPIVHLEAQTKQIFVKTSSGFYSKDPIDLAFSCLNSALVPTPAKATFSGTSGVSVTEPVGCSLIATVNNPKYQQKSYQVNSLLFDLYLEDYEPAATTLKVKIREGGFPVNGSNFKIKLTGQNTYETDTGTASEATLQVSPGTYFVSVSDPKNNYGVATKSVTVTDSTEATIDVTKSVKARVTITVIDSATNETIQGAIVNLRDSYDRELATNTADASGKQTFTFTDMGDYTFIAKMPGEVGVGYFPKSITQTLTGDANITIGLDKITNENAGLTTVMVYDQDSKPVANAKVMLKYKADDGLVELMQNQNYSFTDINGEATLIAGNANGNVYAYAVKGPFTGASQPKEIFIDQLNNYQITAQIGSANIKFNVTDEAGANVNGSAEILLVDGSAPSVHGIAGLISIEDGVANRTIKAGQSVYVRLKADTYEDYYTAPIMLWPDKTYSVNVVMKKQISIPAIELFGSGVYNQSDAPVTTMAAGKEYYAKFLIESDSVYNNVIFNFRAGKENLLENDIMEIDNIDAGGMDSEVRGTSYDPSQGYSFDGANTTDGLAKWVSVNYNSFGKGTRELKVWFRIKNTAPQNAPLQFYWRGQFDSTRVPASTASEDFYADASPSSIYYVGTEAICQSGFCANSEWLYSTADQLYVNDPYQIKQVSPYNYHFSLLNNSGIDYGSGSMQKPVTLSIRVLGDNSGEKNIKINSYTVKNPINSLTNNTPLYAAENLDVTSFEKNTTLDATLSLEGLKEGADAIVFELKSEGQIIYSKETDLSIVHQMDFNVGISPQFVAAMLNVPIEVTVVDEKGNYLPGATVNLYAKEPGYDQYQVDSASTDRMGKAVVNSGAHLQRTTIIIEIIKEGYARQMYSTPVSAQVITASPSDLYIQLNTFSAREASKQISFVNLSKYNLILSKITLDSKFDDVINEDALKAYFNELTEEQRTAKAEDSTDIDLLRIKLANGITSDNFVEPITVEGSIKLAFEEPTTKLTYDVTLPLRVDVSSSANPGSDCIVINPTSKTELTTENAQVRFDFEMVNACASDGVDIPLDTLTVTAPSEIPGTAEISVRNSTGTETADTALDGGNRKLLDKFGAGEKLFGEITFAPGAEAAGKSVQIQVNYQAKFKGETIKGNPQTVTYTANVVNLKECLHIDGDSAPVAFKDKAKINIDPSACLGQMIDVILCYGDTGCSGGADGKISLSKKAFTIQNQSEEIDAYNPTYPGTYGVTVYARTRGSSGFTYIGDVPISFYEKDSQYFNLNKYELNLVGIGSKDNIILTNKMLTEQVGIKANECIWGKTDASFNWANGLMGAMMGAMLGNMIGSAWNPSAPSSSGKDKTGSTSTGSSASTDGLTNDQRTTKISELDNKLQSQGFLNQSDTDLRNNLVTTQNQYLQGVNSWVGGVNTGMGFDPNTVSSTDTMHNAFNGSMSVGDSKTINMDGKSVVVTNMGNDTYFVRSSSLYNGISVPGSTSLGTVGGQLSDAYVNSSGIGNIYHSFTNIFRTTPTWQTLNSGGTGIKPSTSLNPSANSLQIGPLGSPTSSGIGTTPTTTPSWTYGVPSAQNNSTLFPNGANTTLTIGKTPGSMAPLENIQSQAAHFALLGGGGGGTNWFQLSMTIVGALVGGYLMGNNGLYVCSEHYDVVPFDAFVVLLQGTSMGVASPSGAGSTSEKTLSPDAGNLTFTLGGINANWDFSDAQYGQDETVAIDFDNNAINDPLAEYGTLTVNAKVHDYGNKIHVPSGSYSSTGENDFDVFCNTNTFGRYWIGASGGMGACTGVSTHNYAQKYHIRVITGEPKQEDSYIKKATTCYMGALTGATGPDALPKVKLDWSWNSINEDTCDYSNPDHIYCDATQATIALTKKLSALDEFLAVNGGSFECPPDAIQDDVLSTIDELNTNFTVIPTGSIGIKDINVTTNSETDDSVATLEVVNNTGAEQTTYINAVWKGEGEAVADQIGETQSQAAAGTQNDMLQWTAPVGTSVVTFTATTPKLEGIYYFTAAVNGPAGNRQAVTHAFLNRAISNACWMPQTTQSVGGMPGLLYYVAALKNVTWTSRIKNATDLYNHINFGMYLQKDAYSSDFLRDFKQYYLNTPFEQTDATEREIVDYLTSDNFKISKKFSGDNEINPGLYDVWVTLNAPDKFRVIDGNSTNIGVQLLLVNSPSVDSPFYSMPIDGLVGEKGGRQGYGSVYKNSDSTSDAGITFSNNAARYYTFYNAASNGVTSVTTKTTTTFEAENSSVGTRGQVAAVTQSGNTAEIALTPSYATPIIVKQNMQGTEGQMAVTVENPTQPIITRGNLTYWTGAAKSKDFYGANAVETYYNSPDYRLEKLGDNIFGFEFRDTTRTGNMYLKSMMFTPVEKSTYMLVSKDDSTTIWSPNNEFGTNSELLGIGGMQFNDHSNYIKSVQDLFDAVKNQEICVSNDGSSTSFWWNPAYIENQQGGATNESAAQKEFELVGH